MDLAAQLRADRPTCAGDEHARVGRLHDVREDVDVGVDRRPAEPLHPLARAVLERRLATDERPTPTVDRGEEPAGGRPCAAGAETDHEPERLGRDVPDLGDRKLRFLFDYWSAIRAASGRDLGRKLGGPGPGPYTWWSMRGKAFDNDAGWRIDYLLGTGGISEQAREAAVDRAPAYDQRFSDHAPVVVDFGVN